MATLKVMRQGRSAVAGDADQNLIEVLQKTLEAKVLEGLQVPLTQIVHSAVHSAIVIASKAPEIAPAPEGKPAAPEGKPVIARPASGGKCAVVWDTLDKMSADNKGDIPSLKDVKKVAKHRRWNENNTRIEYYRWRNALGIHRQPADQHA